MSDRPRVRIAPSPTGAAHIGLARTALFNWLFARQHDGTFVLRFEDTDTERSSRQSAQTIMETLRWLGLDWDEGPYYQMERLECYRREAQRLLAAGRAYHCYCTVEELEAKRRRALAQGGQVRYDWSCRRLSPDDEKCLIAEGRRPVLRFKFPESGVTVVEDLIKGRVEFDDAELDDFIILRSDGRPTYNFAVVIDDADLRITHVIRGDEHLNNTPKQIQLYRALGYELPQFAHLPMVLDKSRHKLSKRRSQIETSIESYRDGGFLPEALLNFIARLGWAYDDKQEIFSRDELIEKFSLERVGASGAVFDEEKLLWLNQHYLIHGDLERLGKLLREFLIQQKIMSADEAQSLPAERLQTVVGLFKERVHTLVELAESAGYLLTDRLRFDSQGVKKFLTPDVVPLLRALAAGLGELSEFTPERLEPAVRALLAAQDSSLKAAAQPCRVALTGVTRGPGLFEVMAFLGREEMAKRLERAARLIETGQLNRLLVERNGGSRE